MRLRTSIFFAAIFGALSVSGAGAGTARDKFVNSLSGFEFGAGVPLMTPLTGYNMFVGYVNKNASTFLGRRFGLRLDFTIPSALRLNGHMNDNGIDGYDLDLRGKVLGFNLNVSDYVDEELKIDYETDDAGNNIAINGVDASISIKNQNMGLLVDFYPFADTWFLGGIRFSGGYYFGELDVRANARTSQDIGFRYAITSGNGGGNNNTGDYIYAKVARGSNLGASFNWKYRGPYAGFGFDLGIFRGFKFFMDAGVVFANTPKVTNKNINDNNVVIQGRYEISGQTYNDDSNMITIVNGMGEENKPDINDIVTETVGAAVHDFLAVHQAEYASVIAQLPPGFFDVIGTNSIETITNDIVNFLNDDTPTGENTEPWITNLIQDHATTELAETIDNVKQEWQDNYEDATAGVQADVDRIWNDYNEHKQDTIDDINDFFKKYHMIPMIKLGFMYRF